MKEVPVPGCLKIPTGPTFKWSSLLYKEFSYFCTGFNVTASFAVNWFTTDLYFQSKVLK